MIDALCVLGTLVFFALMILYVRACRRLGDQPGAGGPEEDGQ
jgi:hypothetical protein